MPAIKRKPAIEGKRHAVKVVLLALLILACIFIVFYLLVKNPAH